MDAIVRHSVRDDDEGGAGERERERERETMRGAARCGCDARARGTTAVRARNATPRGRCPTALALTRTTTTTRTGRAGITVRAGDEGRGKKKSRASVGRRDRAGAVHGVSASSESATTTAPSPPPEKRRLGVLESSFEHEDGDLVETVRSSTFPREQFIDSNSESDEGGVGTTLWGVIALIVGSSVGGGVLALPATTAQVGIIPADGTLFAIFVLLVCDALLLAEVNVGTMRERDEARLQHGRGHSAVVISFSDMAERTLGFEGKIFTSVLYSFMSLTILVAYISKGGDILSGALNTDHATAATLFTAALGGTIAIGGSRTADVLNRILTYGSTIALVILVIFCAITVDWSDANWVGSVDAIPETVPIIFLTLVYHDLIPIVCTFLQGDMKQIRKSILIGSSIPLVMFLSWNTVILALTGGNITDPLEAVSQNLGGNASALLDCFSVAAVGTSFIGISMGISEFLMPFVDNTLCELNVQKKSASQLSHRVYETMMRYDDQKPKGAPSASRLLTFSGMLAVPLVVAQSSPDLFLPVSNLVGAYGMTTLYGIMPPLMAWNMRNNTKAFRRADPFHPQHRFKVQTLLPGGSFALSALSVSAVAIALSKAHEDLATSVAEPLPIMIGSLVELVADVATVTP